MRYSYATVVCSVLAVLCGCTPVGQWFFGVSADGIKADRFANDPLVKRLAIAVDRGDEAGVAAAVAQGASVNSRGKDGFCLLCWPATTPRALKPCSSTVPTFMPIAAI